MVTNLIHLGDRVEIRPASDNEQRDTLTNSRIYTSKLFDILEDGDLEVAMPIENGRIILLPLGARYELAFYSGSGLCHVTGQVKERYKKENVFVLRFELHSQIQKLQRREYFRCPCMFDVQFYPITEEQADIMTGDQIYALLRGQSVFYNEQKQGMLLDLSGGGAKFIGEDLLEPDDYILVVLKLSNDNTDKQYLIKSRVISSFKAENRNGKIESRVQFLFHDEQMREEIIRFLFEEERRTRRMR